MKKISILLVFLSGILRAQIAYDSLYLKNPNYRHLTGMHALSLTVSADVVFLGNSITYGGNWNELLGRERVVNRGIGSDNTIGMLHRLSSVYRVKPKLCFIMAGINDLYADVPAERVFRNYTMIIDTLTAHHIIPVIQSTLHVNPKWKRSEQKNREIKDLNRLLSEYADMRKIRFLDLNEVLSLGGMLMEEYTTDGVHLTAPAYGQWRDLILPILEEHGL